MFQEGDYLNCDEPYAFVEMSNRGCKWAGFLYERNDGGFDLFYDHENSEFKPVDLAKITLLRHMSTEENGVVFVVHLEEEKNQKKLLENARHHLLEWVTTTIGN